ncbi:hypothetical protein [Pseudomonas sp. BP01]|uniref:hypothetical protein n=1 Tax=Pseudomonas sp. BP01 TaxID=2976152 RepID=UPI001FA9BD1D|nr:hypothetical protein [Pseudomonas sp. BP01]
MHISSIKLQDFKFIGGGMYEVKYMHKSRRFAIQSEFDGFVIIESELYLVCTVFGHAELREVESFSADFNIINHIDELYSTLMGFRALSNIDQ